MSRHRKSQSKSLHLYQIEQQVLASTNPSRVLENMIKLVGANLASQA